MDRSPWFDAPGLFDNRRIRLADTDGSGTTDILYLTGEEIYVYLNESGNALSERKILQGLPAPESDAISVVDFLGHGTACLVWSSSLRSNQLRPLRFIDLMRGKKPHLLTHMSNNLGAETAIDYASSTEFYLADRAAGHPWLTRLPFPVHVVKRVESFDSVSHHRFVSTMSYHHGYYDGVEREFRGFGRVERVDTEDGGDRRFPAGTNDDMAWRLSPVLTKTWYHTGAFLGVDRVSRHLAEEYYRAPGETAEIGLESTVFPRGLTPEEAREACRSLKGLQLRQEVYALDTSEAASRPYTVSEGNATIRLFQPRALNRHCVVFSHARESRTLNYERRLYRVGDELRADPRLTQSVNLAVDDYGNVLTSADLAYGRQLPDPSQLLSDADRARQATLLATTMENIYTNAVHTPEAYRTPALAEARTYELVHFDSGSPAYPLRFEDIRRLVAQAGDGHRDLPFEDTAGTETTGPGPYRRLFKASRNLFRADDLARLLPLGELEALALPGESYSLALTPGLITQVYGDKLQDAVLALHRDGGYAVQADGSWWAPSGRVFYSPDAHDDAAAELAYARRHFFLPFRYRDAFGNVTHVQYDAHDLTVLETRDPLGNIVRGRFDYRALQLGELTDPNGNRSTAAFDALARVAGTALMGKPAEGVGDSLEGFAADLPERVVLEHLTEPLKDPDAILGNATTRFIYDPFAFDRTQCEAQPQPATIYAMARETHISDLAPGERSKIQHAFSYSDGFGREVQKKLQAEPGPIPERGIAEASPRWVGTGWTIFNNKGKPVRQYEPFFSATHHFQFNAAVGVASTVIYDPVGREVAMLNPNHTFRKTIFGPWRQETWDVNDTVLIDLAGDPDIAPLIRSLPAEDYRPTWYEQRVGGELGAAEREAAHKAAMHAGTPTVAFADPLGRAFLTVAHNRLPRGAAIVDEFYASRSTLDIQGDERALTDALGRVVMTYDYDVARRKIHRSSTDSGERWTLSDIAGKPLMRFDSRRHRLRNEYDALRRATALYVRTGDGAEKLAERAEYGEQQPEAEAQNLRGKLYRQFDGAGVVVTPSYDFKGNLLRSSRQILAEYREQVDWNAAPRLESEVFASATSYDALNRPVTMTAPDQSVISPQYNDANLLQRLDVSLKGSSAFAAFVTNIEYDAKGQRQLIEYGNGARTVSTHDPLTFRLVHLKTTRRADGADLQDLRYAYDPVGNITSIADSAQQTVYFNNQVVSARGDYRYDAVYRLIEAEGREHAGAPGRPDTTPDDAGRVHLPLPGDGQAMHNYRERYLYDAVGNILELVHTASDRGNWRRHYRYEQIATNNRLTATSVGELTGRYAYDPDGNMTRMPHLPEMRWDFRDQLAATRTQEVGDGRSAPTTFYVYDSGGHRARKVTVDDDGRRRGDRIYLSGFEMYREYGGDDAVTLERTTLHVVDNERRIAIIDTRDDVATVRYQFANQLGSACLELDKDAAIITYEEYYPYGSTSYQSGRSVAETSLKRYRYIGKERDEETGFSYYGARYYASWLGRWTSADPSGAEDGPNLFQYVSGNPVNNVDTQGNWDISLTDVAIGALTAVVVVGAIALTAGVAAPAIAAGLTAVGVSAETITTLGTVAVAAGTSAGIVGTADTAAEVFTGVDPSTGKTISDQQRSRALGALPVQLLASAIGIRGISSGGGPTGGTSFAPAGGPGSWGNGISIPILNAEPALVGLSLGAAATPAVVNALPPNASAMSAYGDDGDSAASRAAREDRPISRARAEEELREALVNETLTPRQREIIQLIEDEYGKDAIAEFRAGGKLPQGVENSHPYSIQTAPELGRQPGDLVPKSFHRFGVHPGDTNIPLNGDPLAPDYAENSGFLIYDEGGPTYDENGDLIGDQAGTDYLDEYGDDDHDLVCRQRR
jgi:RHS repeat-associated protein